MNINHILDGIARALELERELGVRSLECDRSILENVENVEKVERVEKVEKRPQPPQPSQPSQPSQLSQPPQPLSCFDFVFLHHAPLTGEPLAMMERIEKFLGKTLDTAPVIVEEPLPKAKVYVVLGALAAKKFFPSLHLALEQCVSGQRGEQIVVTYSPVYVCRYSKNSKISKDAKQSMLRSFKVVLQRVAA